MTPPDRNPPQVVPTPGRPASTFRRDVLQLVSGTGVAQIILLAIAPILTRIYEPRAFGVAALFASLTGIIGVLACLRYELAIVLPDNDREAANLLAVSLMIPILIALMIVPILWAGGGWLLGWLKVPELAPYFWLIPFAVLIQGVFSALNYWNTRTKRFKRLAIARVAGALGNTAGSLTVGLAGHATGGALIAAAVVGQTIAATLLGVPVWRVDGRFVFPSTRWREMWVALVRYRKFPLFSSWAALLNAASWQLPVLMLGALFSPLVAGYYALGLRIIQMPMSVIGSAISQVFLQRASVAATSAELSALVEGLFNRLLAVGLLPSLILAFAAEELFVFVFGRQWAEAGFYAELLAPWALVWFISSPLSGLYVVLEQQHREPTIQGLIFLSRVLAIAIGGYFADPRLAIMLFAAGGIISYGYLIAVIFAWCDLRPLAVVRRNRKLVVVALLYAAPIAMIKLNGVGGVYLIAAVGAVLAAYGFAHRKALAATLGR